VSKNEGKCSFPQKGSGMHTTTLHKICANFV